MASRSRSRLQFGAAAEQIRRLTGFGHSLLLRLIPPRVDLIRGGGDPLEEKHKERAAPTVADLFEDFTERHAKIYLRPNTIRSNEGMARKHILPKIGRIRSRI